MRQSIELSSCRLDLGHDALRLPTRPFALRYPEFEDQFDFTTLFNDVFWSDGRDRIVLIAPPLLNLIDDLALKFVALPSGTQCSPVHYRKHWMDHIDLAVPAGTTGLAIECSSVRFVVAPQSGLVSQFEGKRAIFAMSKDNNLDWIRDWVRFYAVEHGCDAVLLYDNNSDRYGLADIDAAIRSAHDGLEVAVVAWPFPYGVFDGRREISYNLWDSYYSQSTLFEHARRRFLAKARSVINADIDELALHVGSRSIFEVVEESQTGYLRYRHGWWIENHLDVTPPDRRHRDYYFRARDGGRTVDWKWAVVPSRCPDRAQWWTHNIIGMSYDEASLDIRLRHMRPINTNWDIHNMLKFEARTASYSGNEADLEVDEALQLSYQRVFADEAAVDGTRDHRPEVTRAYALRILAEQRKRSGSPKEAVGLASEAHRLLPDHPGLAGYLADLLSDDGATEEAECLQAEAARLRNDDAAFHVQMGRLALAQGHLAEARAHFRKAMDCDPGFVEACREFLDCSTQEDAKDPLRAAVGTCLNSVNAGDHLSLASAAELCLKIGMVDEALAAVDRALEIEAHWSYHQLRAQVLNASGRSSEAIAAWQNAIALGQDAPPSRPYPDHTRRQVQRTSLGERLQPSVQYASLSRLLAREGRAPEAEHAARSAADHNPRQPQNWLLLAQCLARNGKEKEADEALAKCRELTGHWLSAMKGSGSYDGQFVGLIELLHKAGGRARAEEEIALARSSGQADWKLEQIAANLAIERDAAPEAVACLRRAIALNSSIRPLYAQLARLLGEQQKWDEVAETWRAVVALMPGDAQAYSRLGEALARTDAVDDAIAAMQRAIDIKGDVPNWFCVLADLLVRQEQWDEAKRACERAIQLSPGLERARAVLSRASMGNRLTTQTPPQAPRPMGSTRSSRNP